ncbi:PaaI family thioesterase [Erythrobacter sp. JK5]|uniref:PaaI family thioesterase n=1 Tax=Erythrobacter sp. JK5 TaxID=2829500 RepID=UPI001BA91D51|nr:PaaI family thioesterase [Erythrobacter sp. JK5]QUL37418.1 PaaI family thioesterase [Erythrobacter sp. JK5]
MAEEHTPDGFERAQFSPGFLDHGGPYFLKHREGGPQIVGLRIMPHHINYRDAAHGGVISTFADVALSHAVYDAERPRLTPSTITLGVNYLHAASLGDWLEALVRIDRLGGRTAYTSGEILRDGGPIATMTGVFAIKRS